MLFMRVGMPASARDTRGAARALSSRTNLKKREHGGEVAVVVLASKEKTSCTGKVS
jgi:hypothetical protein